MTGAVEESGSALAVLQEASAEGPGAQASLFDADGEPAYEQELRQALGDVRTWAAEGFRFTCILDPDYPQQLLTVHQRPPFLLYRGRLDAHDARGVAVVGTRKPTARGLTQAADVARGLAERGTVVVSGLAEGVDTAAHSAALAAGGRTVAVIGTGQRTYYPARNRELQDIIARDHCVLSQFWPDSPPTKTSFPMRNAVMSGYAAATVVIEAAFRSGARMQARLALQHGRPVFLMDSLLEHEWAREYARRPGCTVVTGPDDVLGQLDEALEPVTELVWA